MKKVEQINVFGTKRIEFNEQIQLTVDSLNTYGVLYDHWVVAWSMGKDSTTLLTLIVSLIKSGQIKGPKSLTVICADTRMELLPLWIAAQAIISKLRAMGIIVKVVMAKLDSRFLVYMLGRGVAPPSSTFRWCTQHIKVEPMKEALQELYAVSGKKSLLLTGVRQGESAIRDGRIAMSCGKDGAECGQGWYQEGMNRDICATLAAILHWRVCSIWDWLRVFAPMPKYGGWETRLLADSYGGDEAEEKNARTGCVACPLVKKDKALGLVVKMAEWAYLKPLIRLKRIYAEMKRPLYRLRKDGQVNKDGKLSKNQQRLGPLTLEARLDFLEQILAIQREVNEQARILDRPLLDILNQEEEQRIRQLIALKTWPDGWTGDEITGDVLIDKKYSDGTILKNLFKNSD
jgi:DNA sulfur modification protein DndC